SPTWIGPARCTKPAASSVTSGWRGTSTWATRWSAPVGPSSPAPAAGGDERGDMDRAPRRRAVDGGRAPGAGAEDPARSRLSGARVPGDLRHAREAPRALPGLRGLARRRPAGRGRPRRGPEGLRGAQGRGREDG